MPESFGECQGFNDYKKNLKNKPRMNAEDLGRHSQTLAGLLMLPFLSASNCKKLRTDNKKQCVPLQAYSMYLKKHSEQQQQVHARPQPARDPTVDSVAYVISTSTVTPPYTELQSHMDTVSLYKPVCINDFSPADSFQHLTYISNVCFSVSVHVSNGLWRLLVLCLSLQNCSNPLRS